MTFLDLIRCLEQQSASPDKVCLRSLVEEFREWVGEQPRGESAADDLLTSYFVTFVEGILEHNELFRIAHWVVSKDTLLENKDYFYHWIGPTEYHRALSAFPDEDAKT